MRYLFIALAALLLFAAPAFAADVNVTVTVDGECYLVVDNTDLVFNEYTVDEDGFVFTSQYIPFDLYCNKPTTVHVDWAETETSWDDELYISFPEDTPFEAGVYVDESLKIDMTAGWSLLPGDYTGTLTVTQI